MTAELSTAELAVTLAAVEKELTSATDDRSALEALTLVAARRVEGAEFAGVTIGREGQEFRSVGATDPVVLAVDAIQYELRSGPCVDAVVESDAFNSADLRIDDRWPRFGGRAAAETGVLSMLSYRLFFEDDHDTIAALNLYSRQQAAFGPAGEISGLVLATAGALKVSAVVARQRADQLQGALESNREIGIAIGILMSRYLLTREQGFDALRLASQHSHRKLAELARRVVETGEIPDLGGSGQVTD